MITTEEVYVCIQERKKNLDLIMIIQTKNHSVGKRFLNRKDCVTFNLPDHMENMFRNSSGKKNDDRLNKIKILKLKINLLNFQK